MVHIDGSGGGVYEYRKIMGVEKRKFCITRDFEGEKGAQRLSHLVDRSAINPLHGKHAQGGGEKKRAPGT